MKAFDYSLVKDPPVFRDNRMEVIQIMYIIEMGMKWQTAVQRGTKLFATV